MKVEFPYLYKKTSTGAIQYWAIRVRRVTLGGEIETEYGQFGTDKPQVTHDLIDSGKNIGKKNETTPYEQAQLEAKAKWEKQKKKGYVESIKAAEAGELDELIEGGIVPMLAHSFADHGHKIKYPAFVQPKLDGIRCIAMVKGGKCTLWSRTRKLITGVPHIQRQLEQAFPKQDLILDGELYNHSFKSEFEKIVSFVRQEEPADGHEVVEYHVYDVVNESQFMVRGQHLYDLIHTTKKAKGGLDSVVVVSTSMVMGENEAVEAFTNWRQQGYEGAMLRNAGGLYVNKRSYDLQKVKEFDDAEFDIIGIEEGRGKLSGHVGAFICRTKDGKEFLAKMSGDTGKLKEYFKSHSLWKGKRLTVKYQGLTGAGGVPRFPVGVAIRDYE
jgi:DNA ligase 1